MAPSVSTWGFNHWTLIPTWVTALCLLSAMVLALHPNVFSRNTNPTIGPDLREKRPTKIRDVIVTFSVFSALFIFLYIFRSRALVYGDGFSTLAHLVDSSKDLIFAQYYLQVGSIFLKRYSYEILRELTGVNGELFFSLFNLIGGITAIFAVWSLAGRLRSDVGARVILAVGGMSSGATLLFFGHIEHYTWPLALGLWSLSYVLKYASTNQGAMSAFVFGLAASALHLISLPFLGIAVVVIVWKKIFSEDERFEKAFKVLAVGGVLASVALVATMYVFDLPEVFIPFTVQDNNNYAAFTWAHTRDILNLILFAAPLALVAFVLFSKRAVFLSDAPSRILALTALFCFLPAFWIDPALGMVRDWDLLSMFGIPLSLLISYLLLKRVRTLLPMATATIVVVVVHLAPNVYEKMDLIRATEHLDSMLPDDPHYQPGYHDAYRNQSWARLLRKNVNRPDLAQKYFERHVTTDSTQTHSWNHLGELAFNRQEYDSAASCYERSLNLDRNQPPVWQRLAQSQDMLGKTESAAISIQYAVRLRPNDPLILGTLGVIRLRVGRYEEAVEAFLSGIRNGGNEPLMRYYIGLTHQEAGRWETSLIDLSRAVELDPESSEYLEALLNSQLFLKHFESAAKTLRAWEQFSPPATQVSHYREQFPRR